MVKTLGQLQHYMAAKKMNSHINGQVLDTQPVNCIADGLSTGTASEAADASWFDAPDADGEDKEGLEAMGEGDIGLEG